ncbi:MAG: DUF2071 domain-containing protein [Chloroflexi bacterium]|nr:DUF2071 domain-containing protein [Chloroflexota bacterium]MCI0577243.1 DUF2071 domain-containing protein [Chloroflexota bacterium]MCI0646724.1 DUF2071 domain-containing protein [Chloroflexota bacterium]MCI0731358.1 DUF2071 domain-containing protein [Chloroflexota bacterium]
MKAPTIEGVIERRILVNFRVDPAVLESFLPPPFKPKTVHGFGIAGVCLIRLADIRPQFLPGFFGLSSENAAHRIAVTWEEEGQTREGVYIPRRDSSSTLNTLIGGRLFPGVHHLATFDVDESDNHYHVKLQSHDGETTLEVKARVATALPETSIFESVDEASAFFEAGALGYSPAGEAGCYEGLELEALEWKVQPLAVEHVVSSFFEQPELFPPAAVAFDCALLMQQIPHRWHSRPSMKRQPRESANIVG